MMKHTAIAATHPTGLNAADAALVTAARDAEHWWHQARAGHDARSRNGLPHLSREIAAKWLAARNQVGTASGAAAKAAVWRDVAEWLKVVAGLSSEKVAARVEEEAAAREAIAAETDAKAARSAPAAPSLRSVIEGMQARGVTFTSNGAKLFIGNAILLTDAEMQFVRDHKPPIIELLRRDLIEI